MNLSLISEIKTNKLNLILGALLTLCLSVIYFPALRDIALICWEDDDYSHGLILPLVIAYMWWDQKEGILTKLKDSSEKISKLQSASSYLLIILGLLLLSLGYASQLSYFSWISFFPVTIGIIGLVFNFSVLSIFSGPFLLLIMAKPLPDSVVVRIFWPLQVLAAKIGAYTLKVLGVPVYLSGNVIEIPSMKLMVEEACSGMRSVMALLTLSFIMIFFSQLNKLGKIALVVSSVLLAIALNVFRVSLTGVLAHFYDPEAATGFFHEFSGLLVFLVGLPFIFSFSTFLSKFKWTKSKVEDGNSS